MSLSMLALAAFTGCAFAAASATFAAGDSDLFWHLATGRETLASGLVRADVFSWTARGAALPTDQWLGQVVLYGAYAIGSWGGVLAARTLAVAVVVTCIVAAALARRPSRPIVGIVIALPAILLSRFTWTERPELFGIALFALLVLLLQLPRRVTLLATGPLLVGWANVHGSFALGAVLVLLVAAHGIATGRAPRGAYALAAVGALLAFVLTPAGVGTVTAPGVHLFDPPRQIQEWALPDPTTLPGAIWAALLGLVILSASLSRPANARDLILIVPVALLSLLAVRHTPLLAIAATPYLAEHLPPALREVGTRLGIVGSPSRDVRRWRAPRAVDLALVACGLVLIVAAVAIAPRQPDESGFPVAALEAVPPGPGLFAQYDWGGWLIWRAPATPVFVDGRLAPYRGAILDDYERILEARPGWRELLQRRGIRTILVRPGDPVAVRAQQLGWRTLASARTFVLVAVPDR